MFTFSSDNLIFFYGVWTHVGLGIVIGLKGKFRSGLEGSSIINWFGYF